MFTKKSILTSSVLQNIVFTKYQDYKKFAFIFGEQEFGMKSFFAVLISPNVSLLRETDRTINTINFGE